MKTIDIATITVLLPLPARLGHSLLPTCVAVMPCRANSSLIIFNKISWLGKERVNTVLIIDVYHIYTR